MLGTASVKNLWSNVEIITFVDIDEEMFEYGKEVWFEFELAYEGLRAWWVVIACHWWWCQTRGCQERTEKARWLQKY